MPENKSWFEDWFDSPYYHILYKDRDLQEAENFMDNLLAFLKPKRDARFLDLGCGKGRHAVYLNRKAFDVVGVDLSPESIAYASQFSKNGKTENGNLEFFVQDMRNTGRIHYYDFVFNLFTSFGYFEKEQDNYATINSVSKALKTDGIFVLDFMNAEKVIANLKASETKICEGIQFNITREVKNGFIVKTIDFIDEGNAYHFQEKVKAIKLYDFKHYFASNGLNVVHLFGNYELEAFDPATSDRLILIGKKPSPTLPREGVAKT